MCKRATASLASQTLSVPQCRSLSVHANTESDQCCGMERVWGGVGCETMQQLGGSGGMGGGLGVCPQKMF